MQCLRVRLNQAYFSAVFCSMDLENGSTQGTRPVPMLSILQGGFIAYLEHVATHYPQSVSPGSTPSYEVLQDFVTGFDPNSMATLVPPPRPPLPPCYPTMCPPIQLPGSLGSEIKPVTLLALPLHPPSCSLLCSPVPSPIDVFHIFAHPFAYSLVRSSASCVPTLVPLLCLAPP